MEGTEDQVAEATLEEMLSDMEKMDDSAVEPQLSAFDEFTADIAVTALDAHQKGKIKLLLAKAVQSACTVMANVQMDLDAAEDPTEEDRLPERTYVTVREYAGLDIAWEYERLMQIVDWDAVNAVRNATYHPVVR